VDCEKFENLLIDELYGELDEVTSAAVRRHAAGCARCGALLSGLRATRKVAALPVEEPSADLEDRILSAVREQQKVLPLRVRASTFLSRAGAWAMRPQTAMAAVFLVVIGTSFVLVQQKRGDKSAAITANAEGAPMALQKAPAAAASAYVLDGNESAFAHGVEERRDAPHAAATTAPSTLALAADDEKNDKDTKKEALAPDTAIANAAPIAGATRTTDLSTGTLGGYGWGHDQGGAGGGRGAVATEQQAQRPLARAEAQGPMAPGATNFNTAKQLYDARRFDEARAQWDGLGDAHSLLWAGRAEKSANGCTSAAIQRFDSAAQRAPGQPDGNDALLEAARCYRAMGNTVLARARYSTLVGQGGTYAQTAQNELDSMSPTAAAHKSAPREYAPSPVTTSTTQAKPAQKADSY